MGFDTISNQYVTHRVHDGRELALLVCFLCDDHIEEVEAKAKVKLYVVKDRTSAIARFILQLLAARRLSAA